MTDGVVRACQALESPEVPHLLVPDPDCMARGDFSGDVPNSPVHSALRFNHFTPNPSAPSAPDSPPSLLRPIGESSCAAVVFCIACGDECGPEVQTSYGKCQRCLDLAFLSFARLHCPTLVEQYNSSPSIEGAATLADSGPASPKRLRVASPPHRKAGPPN